MRESLFEKKLEKYNFYEKEALNNISNSKVLMKIKNMRMVKCEKNI